MNDLVSIIVPVYNAAKYLIRCLDSIVEQTYKNIEVILVDDGSSDNSGKICDEYKEKDNRVKVIHSVNQGVSVARNTGIKNANGTYMCFVDSDDYIEKEYVMILYKKIVKWNAELSICNLRSVVGEIVTEATVDCEVIDFNNISPELFLELNKKYLLYGPCNKMYKSNIIKGSQIRFNKDTSYGEDLLFNLAYLKYVANIAFAYDTKYNYIVDNVESLAQRYRKDRYQNGKKIFKELYSFFSDKHLCTEENQKYLYELLFDDAYNSICESSLHNLSLTAIKEIDSIVTDKEVKKAMNLLSLKKYSKVIVFLMKMQKSEMLYRYIIIRSKNMIKGYCERK